MPLVVGPFAIAAALLVVSGIAKMSQPDTTADALRAAGLPSARVLVYLLAVVEILVGTSAFLIGGWVAAAALAIVYLGFLGFVVVTRMRGTQSGGCGCLGARSDAPPGVLHIVVNVFAFSAAVVAVVNPVPGLFEIVQSAPLDGVVFFGFVVLGTWLAAVMLTELPRLQQLMGEGRS